MENKEIIKLGKCNRSKAFAQINKMIADNENFILKFIKKDDGCFHILEHTCYKEEVKVDEDGKKWRRVYEDVDEAGE